MLCNADPHLTYTTEANALYVQNMHNHPDLEFKTRAGGSTLSLFKNLLRTPWVLTPWMNQLEDNKAIIFGTGNDSYMRYDPTPGLLDIRTVVSEPITLSTNDIERLRITSDGTLNLSNGTINLGTADSSSGHINAYELMTFNIDSDNDDSNRHFTWYKNGESGSGTAMMRLNEDGRLGVGGDLATSANNITLKHAMLLKLI